MEEEAGRPQGFLAGAEEGRLLEVSRVKQAYEQAVRHAVETLGRLANDPEKVAQITAYDWLVSVSINATWH